MVRKIAVLGGGIGSLTAVAEITNDPDWREKWDITVYQLGWRLGGKGASGRVQDEYNRIFEHGLHLWMGFYQNAFNLMRHTYDECRRLNLTPDSPFQSAQDAFQPLTLTSMMEGVDTGKLSHWDIHWPVLREDPSSPDSPFVFPGKDDLFAPGQHPPRPWEFGKLLAKKAVQFFEEAVGIIPALGKAVGTVGDSVADTTGGPTRGDHRSHLDKAVATIPEDRPPSPDECKVIEGLMAAFGDAFHLAYRVLKHVDGSDAFRRIAIIVDTAVYMARGLYRDVINKGYGAIEHLDFSEWLKISGSHYTDSTLIRGFYDACFGYRNGDSSTPNMAAGSTLYGCLRLMLNYDGAIMWWMRAGMGDTIASPIYLLLKERGVKFEFFHKVTNLGVTGRAVTTIDIDVQATPKDPAGYSPLIQVGGLPCWPYQALFDQLQEGETLKQNNINLESWWNGWDPVAKKQLKAGTDYDLVILGLAIGAFPYVCKELIEKDASGKWKGMVARVETVKTQALQLWLNKPMSETWSESASPCLCSYVEPYDTWADMSHLIPRESWPPGMVSQIAYFCDAYPNGPASPPFSDTDYPSREQAHATELAANFVAKNLAPLWPGAANSDGSFNYNVLVDVKNQQGPQRFDSQFVRVNVDPTELYVLSIADSTRFRLHPGDSQFTGLYLAGDWTLTDPNIGCVEATVVSGRLCSQAICGLPKFIYQAMDDFSGTAGIAAGAAG